MSPNATAALRVNRTIVGRAALAVALGILVIPAPVTACTTQLAMAVPTAEMVALIAQAPAGVERDFQLAPAKADALFALLAPDDVKVLVSRRGEKVHVRGTRGEVGALSKLVELVNRLEGKDIASDESLFKKLQATWTDEKEYKLPAAKADALFTILAFDDVPVLVMRTPNGVKISASRADHKTVAMVTAVMMGKRNVDPRAKKPDAKPRKKRAKREGAKATPEHEHDHDHGVAHGDMAAEHEELIKWKNDFTRQAKDLEKKARQLQKSAQKLQRELDNKSKELHEKFAAAGREAPDRKARRTRRGEDGNPDEVIERKYKLPAHHAENLFNLFAPDDIRDVIVSREGDTVEIRASRRDHRAIQQMVDILKRSGG